MKNQIEKCCFCGWPLAFEEKNNAEPVAKGYCCELCNERIVKPARIEERHTSLQIDELCERTGTNRAGIDKLIEYYQSANGWSKQEGMNYILKLFEDGTIKTIKFILNGAEEDNGSKKGGKKHASK